MAEKILLMSDIHIMEPGHADHWFRSGGPVSALSGPCR
jgi:hypothetical protein